ncbi:MAG: hypothetical protein Q9168_002474 [Polycauliona sp. 1 TL-2023]
MDLPSLSQTSPINHVTNPGTASPAAEVFPRIRRSSKADAPTRQRRAAAVALAKREVLANVQEGWTWPPSAHQLADNFPRRRKSTQWQERESDTSPRPSRSPSPSETVQYQNGSLNAVEAGHLRGRNKRRKLLHDELKWNPGLRVFLERRDCWTGAEVHPDPSSPVESRPSNTEQTATCELTSSKVGPSAMVSPIAIASNHDSDQSSSLSVSSQSLPTPTSQASSAPTSTRTSQSSEPISPSSPLSHTISAPLIKTPPISQEHPATTATRTLIPRGPSLLSPQDHPFLTPITPVLYPTLYSKCIVQSLAPSFPINLSHIVGSLVQGWKDEGEWPPKSTVEEDANARGRKGSLRGKMKSLRIDIEGNGTQVGLERVARRSVGKVKRVLGG